MGKNEPIRPSSKTAPATAAKPPKAPSAVKKAKGPKPPLKQRILIKADYYRARLARFGKVLGSIKHDSLHNASAFVDAAVEALEAATSEAVKLPDDFRRGTGPKLEVETGSVVSIRDKRRALYSGVLDADEMDGLTVVKVVNAGKTVLCTTSEGVRQMFPVAHLRATAGAEADADAAE
jgi:hypothetical protein